MLQVQRKLQAIQADSKANPNALLAAEESASQMKEMVTNCSVVAYKTRALKQVLEM